MTISKDIIQYIGIPKEINGKNYISLLRTLCYINIIICYFIVYNVYRYCVSPFLQVVTPSAEKVWRHNIEMGFWTVCVFVMEKNHWSIELLGDQLELENALLLSNHAGIIDYIIFGYLIQQSTVSSNIKNENINQLVPIFARGFSNMLMPHLSFFTWFAIWSVPTVGYLKNTLQSDENWELDGETLSTLFEAFLNDSHCDVQWLVMFPEVNIYSDKDSKLQKLLGEKYFLPNFSHLLYPRFGGVTNAVGGLYETKFTRLYDITLTYYHVDTDTEKVEFGCPSLFDALGFTNKKYTAAVNVKGKFLSRVPLKRNKLEKWIENRWTKKDKLIQKMEQKIVKRNKKNN